MADTTDTSQEKSTVDTRQEKDKEAIVENLRKIPIVQISCERAGINRSTYYRWRKLDATFAKAADEAIKTGLAMVNDLAESQLISAIRDQNMSGIIFWLKHRHKAYRNKVEISGKIKTDTNKLTPEQEQAILKALELSTLNNNAPKRKE
ncbi:MAG: phBC6A51 family helix-turn-helix protein [Patescibacteria group bacterium]|nr:phBC6A51 family helix-turn-helix protein [Patescibacteria group bacterium]